MMRSEVPFGGPTHISGTTTAAQDLKSALSRSSSHEPWVTVDTDALPPSRVWEERYNSKDSLPSLSASVSSPSESRRRTSRSSSGATQELVAHEPVWGSSTHHLVDYPQSDAPRDRLDYVPKKSRSAKSKVHIKPMLKRLSRDEVPSTSIDLSRSSFEQEGLGIYTNFERERRTSDSFANIAARRSVSGVHNRSTSGASQLSAASTLAMGKPGTHCVHPMRQIPRAYTPPLSQSYQTSLTESDDSEDAAGAGTPVGRSSLDHFRPFAARVSSGQEPRLSLQTYDIGYRRSSPGVSQANVTGRASLGLTRETTSTLDTASPVSRSSLDFVFRSRTRNSMEPVSRAATVQAARQAFEEKEAEKARRLQRQQMKAEEREARRREKQHSRKSSKDEPPQPQSKPKPVDSTLSEKAGVPDAADHGPSPPRPSRTRSRALKSQSKNTWVLFMTWLRTRVFKLRRKIRKRG